MRKTNKRELRILVIFILSLVVGLPYLFAVGKVARSTVAYAKIEATIADNKWYGDQNGWTDKQTAEGEAAKAERAEMAKADPVIGFLDATRENLMYNAVRYIMGFGMLVLAGYILWVQIANGVYLFKEYVSPKICGVKQSVKLMKIKAWHRMQKRFIQKHGYSIKEVPARICHSFWDFTAKFNKR